MYVLLDVALGYKHGYPEFDEHWGGSTLNTEIRNKKQAEHMQFTPEQMHLFSAVYHNVVRL